MNNIDALTKIQQTATYQIRDTVLACSVRVLAVRQEYGRTRFNITPVTGSGALWVDETSLTFPTVSEKGV